MYSARKKLERMCVEMPIIFELWTIKKESLSQIKFQVKNNNLDK